ncbi:MAG: hypothetical protein LBM87_03745 [Ruminococcus sp.]|jgi:hypothetical protein|nr:hypothetical protein [Ruminococcus sp.]
MNNFLKRLSDKFSRLMEQDVFIILLSIFSAIIIWFIISVSVYPTIERELFNVPVVVNMLGTQAEANNMEVSGLSVQTVAVHISGERAQVGDITADDIQAVVSADVVASPKEYSLKVDIISKDGRKFDVLAIDPPMIDVEFDRITSKEVPVKVDTSNIIPAEGYYTDDEYIVIAPSVVTVTGTDTLVESITEVTVALPDDMPSDRSFETVSSDYKLYNGDFVVEDSQADITLDRSSFNISVPIYRKQTVSLDVTFTNYPKSFDLDLFRDKLKFSISQLDIGTLNAPAEITSINIGNIDMRFADLGSAFTFDTASFLPEGYDNLSSIDRVTVTCPTTADGYVKRVFYILARDIQLTGRLPQYNYSIISSGVTATYIGLASDEFTASDIVANVDLNTNPISGPGDYKLTVDLSVPGFPDTWIVASEGVATPKVSVTVS